MIELKLNNVGLSDAITFVEMLFQWFCKNRLVEVSYSNNHNFKDNSLIWKVFVPVRSIESLRLCTEKHLEPSRTSTMELSCKNSELTKPS